MIPRRSVLPFVLAIALLSLAAGTAGAAEKAGWAYGLANSLMSPYCPGRSLPDCPSPQAAQLREWIVAQEGLGRERSEVERELVDRYGETILQAPRARGFGLAAWVMPLLAVAAGGVVVVIFLRRQGAGAGRETLPPALARTSGAYDAELDRRLDAELGGRE